MEKFRRENREQIQKIFEEKTGVRLNVRPQRPRWVRMALTAACVCAVLLGAVYAVEAVAGVRFSHIFAAKQIEWEDGTAYSVDGFELWNDVEPVPVDSLSEEVRNLTERYPNDSVNFKCESWDEAETLLGLEIQDNPVLDRMTKAYPYNIIGASNGRISDAHCCVSLGTRDAEIRGFHVFASYQWQLEKGMPEDSVLIQIDAITYTDATVQSPGYSHEMWFHEGTAFQYSDYITPDGLEAVMMQVDRTGCVEDYVLERYRGIEYYAYFSLNNSLLEIRAASNNPENLDLALTALRQVLDGFS